MLVKFSLKHNFHTRKLFRNCRLRNGRHYVSASMCWFRSWCVFVWASPKYFICTKLWYIVCYMQKSYLFCRDYIISSQTNHVVYLHCGHDCCNCDEVTMKKIGKIWTWNYNKTEQDTNHVRKSFSVRYLVCIYIYIYIYIHIWITYAIGITEIVWW